MKRSLISLAGFASAAAGAVIVLRRHGRIGHGRAGHHVAGGTVMDDASFYDRTGRLLLGGFTRSIARDVAVDLPAGARILDVGCGPGHLAYELADRYAFDVTGIDLDPGMIDRAIARGASRGDGELRPPTFLVADAAALPFPDESFDLVVSTLSTHHWDDVDAGLRELARVVRPEGRILIWELAGRTIPLHGRMPDPAIRLGGAGLPLVRQTAWHWPLRIHLTDRLELRRP
jgi:SAM-dependent methyltransferase